MNITKKRVYGYYDYQDRYFEGDWWWGNMVSLGAHQLDYLDEVKKDLEAIEILINSNFNDLQDKDFYYLISRFYLVDLTINDFLNILSRVNSVYYDKLELLNSRQIFGIVKSGGHGKDYDSWIEKYQINLLVATARNFNLKQNYNYSIDEIEKMGLNQFIAISRCAKYIGRDRVNLPYEKESYDEMNIQCLECDSKYFTNITNGLPISFNCLEQGKSDLNKKIYKEACSMIRMRLNKKYVLNDCKMILLFLNRELERLVIGIKEEEVYVYNFQKERYLCLSSELIGINKRLLLKLENK